MSFGEGEVMKSNRDIEIIYKNGIVRSVKRHHFHHVVEVSFRSTFTFKGKIPKKLTKKENKRIQKLIDVMVKSYAEDDW